MSRDNDLMQAAIEVANNIKERALQTEKEYLHLQAQLHQKQAALDALNLSHERLFSFEPNIDGDIQCPRCWMSREVHVSLHPVPSGTELDYFRCNECGFELETEG